MAQNTIEAAAVTAVREALKVGQVQGQVQGLTEAAAWIHDAADITTGDSHKWLMSAVKFLEHMARIRAGHYSENGDSHLRRSNPVTERHMPTWVSRSQVLR